MNAIVETPRLKGKRCVCNGCGLLFNSEAAFNKHRVGPFAAITEANTRRCLSQAEMRSTGMTTNDAGFWVSEVWNR